MFYLQVEWIEGRWNPALARLEIQLRCANPAGKLNLWDASLSAQATQQLRDLLRQAPAETGHAEATRQ